ncbi:VanZ family protein [Nocardioides aquiterrae]|uniref:VanZ-like domain-containing protein n=1 Tax=Nocardioides aquiterrae TaxID=203799 RepID=A0ABN1UF22_9ACTN
MLHPTPRSTRWLTVALVAYGAFLAVVLLTPTAGPQSSSVGWVDTLAHRLGAPAAFTAPGRVEFVCNALILMPVSALGSVRWPRTTWRDWTAYAFVIASGVELVQGLLLPGRSASFADVVANTLGGLGGAVFVAVLRSRRSAP